MESHPYKKRWGVGGTFLLVPNPEWTFGGTGRRIKNHGEYEQTV